MEKVIELQRQLVPDILEVLSARYLILRTIKYRQPIGRRMLSSVIGLSERVVRSEVNFLKTQGLIDVKASGMYITKEGETLFKGLKPIINDIDDINHIEVELKTRLGIKDVVIISGNASENSTLLSEVGKAAANYIKDLLKDDITISLTGGSTIKEVVSNFTPTASYKNLKVLPGRGGMGKETELQSNTLVEILANKLGATYEQLHIPDNLSRSLFQALLKETEIENIFKNIEKSDVLIHGIGLANEMCFKRNLTDEVKNEIMSRGAIGEAFGHFFNEEGVIVYSMPSIGVGEEKIKDIPEIVAVAVGIEKAKAIRAIEKGRENSTLITDEATANEILKLFK